MWVLCTTNVGLKNWSSYSFVSCCCEILHKHFVTEKLSVYLFRHNYGWGREWLSFPTIPASTWTSDSGWCRQRTFVCWFFPSFGCSQRPLLTVMLSLKSAHDTSKYLVFYYGLLSHCFCGWTLNGQIITETDYYYRRNYAKWKCLLRRCDWSWSYKYHD